MRITPLQPIERNGLKGFGFSITFDNETQSRGLSSSQDSAKDRSGDRPPAAPVRLFDPWHVYREHRP